MQKIAGYYAPLKSGKLPSMLLALSCCVYIAIGAMTMIFLSPRVLYADPWRFAKRLLSEPWPQNVLAENNGHREVIPNALRLVELKWLGGDQWLQSWVGLGFALLTVWLLIRIVETERLNVVAHWAASLVCVLIIFWLGNERVLAHGCEAVHAYLITTFLLSACWMLCGGNQLWRAALAALSGFSAALCFGAGVAVFIALFAVLTLRRSPWQQWSVIGGGFALTLLLMTGGSDPRAPGVQDVELFALLDNIVRWLVAPLIYTVLPLIDERIAMQLPISSVRSFAVATSNFYASVFGPALTSAWPHRLVGLTGLGSLVTITFVLWRRRTVSMAQVTAISIAWFALAVGGLVAIVRASYFVSFPEQLMATRYVPWSVLFWGGVLLWFFLHYGRLHPRRTALAGLALALCLAPSTVWMALLAQRMQHVAEQTATAAASGVIDSEADHGESVPSEIADALPVLRKEKTSIFAWAETRFLHGEAVKVAPVAVANVGVSPIRNMLGGEPSIRLAFDADTSASRLILMCEGVPLGMAVRVGQDNHWIGWGSRMVMPSCVKALKVRSAEA